MPYADRATFEATLIVHGVCVPVVVKLAEAVDTRSGRRRREGCLWSAEMPVTLSPGDDATIALMDETAERIRVTRVQRAGGVAGTSCVADFVGYRHWKHEGE